MSYRSFLLLICGSLTTAGGNVLARTLRETHRAPWQPGDEWRVCERTGANYTTFYSVGALSAIAGHCKLFRCIGTRTPAHTHTVTHSTGLRWPSVARWYFTPQTYFDYGSARSDTSAYAPRLCSRFAKTPHSRCFLSKKESHANIRHCRSSVRTYDLVCCAR